MVDLFSKISELGLIYEYLIKSTLVLSLAILLAFLFRKHSASIRHFLLSISLIGILLFPFLSTVTGGWETKLLPNWHILKKQANISIELAESKINQNQLIRNKNHILSESSYGLNSIETRQSSEKKANFKFSHILGYGLLAIWSGGILFLLFKISLGLYGACRLTRQGEELEDSPWKKLLNHFMAAVSLKRKVNLKGHKRVKIPFTWGVIKPVVVMPSESKNWTEDEQSSALFHELSHVKRGDFLIMMLARISCALFWFNPLSWLAFKMMKREQEKACDELVLKFGIKPSTYAANLLSIKQAKGARWDPPEAVLGAVGKSQLNERLLAILKQRFNLMEVKMKTKIMLSFLVILAVSVIGLARPSTSEAKNDLEFAKKDIFLTDSPDLFQETEAEKKQEKKQSDKTEKKETQEKKDKKEKVKYITVDIKKGPIEIVITEGKETKTIKFENEPIVIIKKGTPENKITLISPNKDWTIKEGEEGHIMLKCGKKLDLLKDADVICLNKGAVWHLKTEGEGDRKVLKPGTAIRIKKDIKIPKRIEIHVDEKEGEKKRVIISPHVKVDATPHVKLAVEPKLSLKLEELKLRARLKKIQDMLKKIKENKLDSLETLEKYEEYKSELQDKDVKQKLEEILEGISKELEYRAVSQEKALEELEAALEKLNKELEKKEDELKKIDVYVKKVPHVDIDEHMEKTDEAKVDITFKESELEEGSVVGFIGEDEAGSFSVMIKSEFNETQKEIYDKALERLKAKLPDNYKVESHIDEDKKTIRISIISGDKKEALKDDLKKLLKNFINEIKEIKKKVLEI